MNAVDWYLLRFCNSEWAYSLQELVNASALPAEQLSDSLGRLGVELPDGRWLIAPGCDEYPGDPGDPLPPGLQDVPAELRRRYWTESATNRGTMQVTTSKSEIARAFLLLTRTTAKKGLHALTGTMKLRAVSDPEEQSCLLCYSTDGVAFAGASVAAEVKSVGEVVVPSHQIERILAAMPDGEVELHATERNLTIAAGKGCRFRLPILGIDYPREAEFPDVPNTIELPGRFLREAIRRVESCRLVDGAQPHLMGVLLRASGDSLTAVAVDGHHAARTVMRAPEGTHLPIVWSCLLPSNVLRSLTDLTEEEGLISISFASAVFLANSDSLIGCALPGGDFPDLSSAFHKQAQPWFRVAMTALEEGLKIVSAASSDRFLSVQLSIEDGELVLESQPSERDLEEYTMARTVVPLLEVLGDAPTVPLEVAVVYLRNALRGMSPSFTVAFNDEFVRFTSDHSPDFEGLAEAIIMPIRDTNQENQS